MGDLVLKFNLYLHSLICSIINCKCKKLVLLGTRCILLAYHLSPEWQCLMFTAAMNQSVQFGVCSSFCKSFVLVGGGGEWVCGGLHKTLFWMHQNVAMRCLVQTEDWFWPQLSPVILLMSGVAHDGGMLQSWLFTSRSQNLVSGKLRSSGFRSYSNF